MCSHGADWDRQQTSLYGYTSHIKDTIYSQYIDDWYTVKPVCNNHLSENIYYLWFIQ